MRDSDPAAHIRSSRFADVLRRGTVLGAVLAFHLALVIGLTAYAARTDDAAHVALVTDAPLEVTIHERHIRGPVLVAHPAQVEPTRPTPAVRPRPAVRAALPPEPQPARAVVQMTGAAADLTNEVVTPAAPALPSYSGGDPALRQALSDSAHRMPVGLPGYATGSQVDSLVLAPPSSLRDSFRAAGNALSCNAIKMQRNKAGNGVSAALEKAYDEMGCTG